MLPPDAVCAFAALFIVAMVWLRTRLHYRRRSAPPPARALTPAGWVYFASLVVLLGVGFPAAPALAARLAPATPAAPILARVCWFLATYYLFIPVHRVLQGRGVEVFKAPVAGMQG